MISDSSGIQPRALLTHELLTQLDRSILLIAGLASRPQFHRIALRQAGLGAGRQPDHPAHLIDPALYGILVELNSDKRQGVTSIANRLGLHPATVSHHLHTLVERQLVNVGLGLIDRRSRVATVTPLGQEALSALTLARCALLGQLLEYWDEADAQGLARLLHAFASSAARLHMDEQCRRNDIRTGRPTGGAGTPEEVGWRSSC